MNKNVKEIYDNVLTIVLDEFRLQKNGCLTKMNRTVWAHVYH